MPIEAAKKQIFLYNSYNCCYKSSNQALTLAYTRINSIYEFLHFPLHLQYFKHFSPRVPHLQFLQLSVLHPHVVKTTSIDNAFDVDICHRGKNLITFSESYFQPHNVGLGKFIFAKHSAHNHPDWYTDLFIC